MNSCSTIIKRLEEFATCKQTVSKTDFSTPMSVALRDVSYSYGEKEALKGVSLTLESGKRYVILGSNGSGKSTLLRILSRFYEDYGGEIFYGDTEARQIEATSFYSKTILLQQEVLILKDTVKNNILLYDENIDTAKLQHIIRTLQLEKLFSCEEVCLATGTIFQAAKNNGLPRPER